jgi:H+/Cl- antiporter ClcA
MTSLKNLYTFKTLTVLRSLVRWFLLTAPLAITVGSIVAFFLWALKRSIHYRFEHPWLLYLLPLAGVAIHFIYQFIGKHAEKGNTLILEQIQEDSGTVPKRMAPLILATTLMTHLFGGSAGREGTAVQMGGSIASMFNGLFKLGSKDRRIMLSAGLAAGFGAVFGTPITGAIFAIEVLTRGKFNYKVLLPALMASLLADATVNAWAVSHQHYRIDELPISADYFSRTLHFDLLLVLKVIPAAAAFGLASYLFTHMIGKIKAACNHLFKIKWLIPFVGGLLIIVLTQLLGKPDYLSLGVDPEYPAAVTLQSAFHLGGAHPWSWFWKTIYTTITIGTGFKGGEVTPLFYIGATLGNILSVILNAPVSLFAALGFIAVFAGATNTPLACTIMGAELFGTEHIAFFALACFIAYLCSGHIGIYGQREPAKRSRYLREKLARYC